MIEPVLHSAAMEGCGEDQAIQPRVVHQSSLGSGSSSGAGYHFKNEEWHSERRLLDITRDKPVKVAVRVAVPVHDHPKFNFVGKLLGPRGNSLKRLQEDTMCKMAVLGRGSIRDRHKEEELRMSGDPKFGHLEEELHVEISAYATPAEAHARIAYALAELRRFLVPDYNDDIRQEQMLEIQILSSQLQNEGQVGIQSELQAHPRGLTPPRRNSSSAETPRTEEHPATSQHHQTTTMTQTVLPHHQHQSQTQSQRHATHQGHSLMNGHCDVSPSYEDVLSQGHHRVLTNTPHQYQLASHGGGVLVSTQTGGHLITQDGRQLIQTQTGGTHNILAAQNGIMAGQDTILGPNSLLMSQGARTVPLLAAASGLLRPAKAASSQGASPGVVARKRALCGRAAGTASARGSMAMSPTKRAVLALLARARAAQVSRAPHAASAWTPAHEHATLLPETTIWPA